MVARLPGTVMVISQEVIPTDFLSPFSAAVTIIGDSYRTLRTSVPSDTRIRFGRYASAKSPTMPPERLILTLLVEYMKCVTYEL